jgi:agmatine deiminase
MSRSQGEARSIADTPEPRRSTPKADGFAMPAEWAPHQLTLMSWPCRVDGYTRPGLAVEPAAFDDAKRQQATVANAVAEFESVLMLVRPEQLREARGMLSSAVELLEAELDDAWLRDNGPIFVTDAAGQVAMVDFGFNGWGDYFGSYSLDARVPELVADHLGVRRYVAPMILEGGSFFVDGEGTLITTEQCLLNVNRNPSMTREEIETTLREYLGVDRVLWLREGHYDDFATDGHIDDVAHFLSPGRVILHAPSNPAHPDHAKGIDNAHRIVQTPDARGRTIEIIEFDTGDSDGIPYLNLYVCNNAVIAPIANAPADEVALAEIQAAYPGRKVVPVLADVLFTYGGGGPHCITQQVPAGTFVL